MSKILMLGVDDGNHSIKVYLDENRKFIIPSRAKAGADDRISLKNEKRKAFPYETEIGPYQVGDVENADPTRNEDYPISALNRVLVHHALLNAGLGGQDVNICTGLPLQTFYKGSSVNHDLIRLKRENLLKSDIHPLFQDLKGNDVFPANIKEHFVVAECVATWLDFIIRLDQKTQDFEIDQKRAAQRVAIVDIGGRTTDTAVIEDWDVIRSRSSTVDLGMLDVYDRLKELIIETFSKENAKPSDSQIRKAVSSNKIKIFGKEKNIEKLVLQAKKDVVNSIRSEVGLRLGNGSDLDTVILTGGGSSAFGDLLKGMYPHQILAVDPQFSNARGMQKFAMMKSQ